MHQDKWLKYSFFKKKAFENEDKTISERKKKNSV